MRIGYGGRDQGVGMSHGKQQFEITDHRYSATRTQLEFIDNNSTSGDSGGPVYSVEDDEPCLLGIHSSRSIKNTEQGVISNYTYSTFINGVFIDLMKAHPADQIQN